MSAAPSTLPRLSRRRRWLDAGTRGVVGAGGVSVIGAILLIFIYLLWVVAPIFSGASVEAGEPFRFASQPVHVGADDNGEFAWAVSADGGVEFVPLHAEGSPLRVDLPVSGSVTGVVRVGGDAELLGLVIDRRELLLVQFGYQVRFDDDTRVVEPSVAPAFGAEPLPLEDMDSSFAALDLYLVDGSLLLAALLDDGDWLLAAWSDVEPGYELYEPDSVVIRSAPEGTAHVFIGDAGGRVQLLDDAGMLTLLDTSFPDDPLELLRQPLLPEGGQVHAAQPLLGGLSLLIADDRQRVVQWFPVRAADGDWSMVSPRHFELPADAVALLPEQHRKGLVAVTADGQAHLLHTTAQRELGSFGSALDQQVLGLSPGADLLLAAAADGTVTPWHIDNEHPEISWHALWEKVWYEGYREPVHSWQSSSADNDFEPKFSLTPLAFGTLKAAFYAMLFAMPLAITGAIYTAYFMAPAMRNWIKPGIEIMAALPTVILGFIGGLWLAPLIEEQLAAVLTLLFVLPVGLLLFAWLWRLLPGAVSSRLGDGWEAAIAVLPIVGVTVVVFMSGDALEAGLFAGDAQGWFRDSFGMGYDQRNALVVGIAMGLAVIPTIFSISEDAIYSVPKHLTNGSLALGATQWQTLTRVVLLTASPGIFSAVMIGLGRAVGETMIVLMATGNTPVMDFSIFQGMRTFSANIAVELPESEVASTHYRILFLAALVLFMLTFAFNTAAELVRQRLRERYGNL